MKSLKHLLVFFCARLIVDCSKDRDSLSENDVDPNFVASTTPLLLDFENVGVLECFYENNFVELSIKTNLNSTIKSASWFFIQDTIDLLVSELAQPTVSKEGSYKVKLEIETDGEVKQNFLLFDLKYCDVYLEIPDAFKPNNDGEFDFWGPIGEGVANIKYTISTRRGKKLFESTSLENLWDGTYDQKKMPSGTYKYYISGTYKNGYLFEKKGTFELIR